MIDWKHIKTAEQLQVEKDEAAWAALRGERDRRLSACDWAVLPDVNPPGGREAWIEYRAALRDLPKKTEDPNAPNWPTPPI